MQFILRDRRDVEKILKKIEKINPSYDITIMEVCGSHSQTISKFALRSLLPKNIHLISGPGCPVCVTPARNIDIALEMAKNKDVIITTFGDAYRLPGTNGSLAEMKNVKIIYSLEESVELARKNPDKHIVHLAMGFETTSPSTAVEILENQDLDNFHIISSHRLIPPAMEFLVKGNNNIDAFICPGHVSAIIGSKPYEKLAKVYKKPSVVSGFEPVDVFLATYMILEQLTTNDIKVEIEYDRAVRPEGNVVALNKLKEVFDVEDANWRGLGVIEKSGFVLKKKFEKFDALKIFDVEVGESVDIKPGCKCGDIMKGLAKPTDCPHFKRGCTPQRPVGPCMVSVEGACNVAYRYGY
ncbi:MAG: hydrogenase formation protein HypD [Candidatus Aenigmarchaeota archaeon]|nr:hydrogenase formation protein HypD [Candidatus Aenigmarchaeota archaeon]